MKIFSAFSSAESSRRKPQTSVSMATRLSLFSVYFLWKDVHWTRCIERKTFFVEKDFLLSSWMLYHLQSRLGKSRPWANVYQQRKTCMNKWRLQESWSTSSHDARVELCRTIMNLIMNYSFMMNLENKKLKLKFCRYRRSKLKISNGETRAFDLENQFWSTFKTEKLWDFFSRSLPLALIECRTWK